MDINQIISDTVIALVLLLITGVIVPLIKKLADIIEQKATEIKGKLTEDQLKLLNQFVTIAVKCAEQIHSSEQYKEKKQYVIDYINTLIDNDTIKIKLTAEQIDTIIEGIVFEVKKGSKQIEEKTE